MSDLKQVTVSRCSWCGAIVVITYALGEETRQDLTKRSKPNTVPPRIVSVEDREKADAEWTVTPGCRCLMIPQDELEKAFLNDASQHWLNNMTPDREYSVPTDHIRNLINKYYLPPKKDAI